MRRDTRDIERIIVDQPGKLVNPIRASFSKALRIPDASIKEVPQARNEVALVLRGRGGEGIGGSEIALPFVELTHAIYWLSAKLVMEPFRDKYALKRVSISILRGPPREAKAHILRAEWDCPISIENTHAQPHWHVYPSAIASHAEGTQVHDLLSERPPVFSFYDNDLEQAGDPVKKLHLAMSATWQMTTNAQCRLTMPQEANICAWIENCTTYLREQIELVG